MRHGERPEHQAARRCHLLLGVAHERHDVRLVHGAPVRDAVAQPLRHERGVLAEAQGGVPLEPPPGILERLREVPVEERRHRLDAGLEQAVDEPVVEREARLVDGAAARRLHAGPGHREAVAVGAQALHEGDVLRPAVVVVAGHGPVGAVEDATGLSREGVPDAGATAVLVDGALDLVGGGARAEDEVRRQAEVVASWVVAAHRSLPSGAAPADALVRACWRRPGRIIAHPAGCRAGSCAKRHATGCTELEVHPGGAVVARGGPGVGGEGDLAVRQHPQLRGREHDVEPAAGRPRGIGRPLGRDQAQPVGDVEQPPGTSGVVLVEVPGEHERPPVRDRREDALGVGHPLSAP